MTAELRIEDRSVGEPTRPSEPWTLRLVSERLTVRELIRRRVGVEVAAHNAHTRELYHGLVQPTESERVLNGYRVRDGRRLDSEEQARIAVEAFARNGFFILFDGRQLGDLDEEITVSEASTATFYRLVPLVGG